MNKLQQISSSQEKSPAKILTLLNKTYDKKLSMIVIGEEFPLVNAVGAASKHLFTPKVVLLNQEHLGKSKYILSGKGITFDSGGYDLKVGSSACMHHMHYDKVGAMIVADYCAKYQRAGLIFLTPNLIGSNGTVSGTIVKSYGGQKVEIVNTDAEGRLGLADLASYALKHFPSKHVVHVATLTGFAPYVAGGKGNFAILNTTDQKLVKHTVNNFKDVKMWPLPYLLEYTKAIKSPRTGADLQNISPNYYGAGTQTAYAFLREFNKNSSLVDLAAFSCDSNRNPVKYGPTELHKLLGNK